MAPSLSDSRVWNFCRHGLSNFPFYFNVSEDRIVWHSSLSPKNESLSGVSTSKGPYCSETRFLSISFCYEPPLVFFVYISLLRIWWSVKQFVLPVWRVTAFSIRTLLYLRRISLGLMFRLLNFRPTSSLMSETSFRVSTSLEPYCPRKPDSFHTLLIWTTLLSTLSLLGWWWSIKQFFLWTSLQFTLIFFSEEWDLIRDFGSLGSILSPKTGFILHLFVMNQLLGEPTTITSRTLLFLGRMRFDVWFQLLRIHTSSKTWFFFTPFCYELPLSSFEYFQPTLRLVGFRFSE